MKIQCGVCDKHEATLFCVAEDAALCKTCDHRLHHANKLASKHHRFTLLQPSFKQVPLCDICQEKRAFLFCQQDRAILCRECDVNIHKANEHTKKHNRFFLTGVKLSATSTIYSSSSSSSSSSPATSGPSISNGSDAVHAFNNPQSSTKNNVSSISHKDGGGNICSSQMMSGSTSSISEYLMEMLPGWHFEDFLDSSSPDIFSKGNEDDLQPFWGNDLSQGLSSFSTTTTAQSTSLWVPQAPPPALVTPDQNYPSSVTQQFDAQIGSKESKDVTFIRPSRKLSDDNSFAVPQISSLSNAFKRSRNFW